MSGAIAGPGFLVQMGDGASPENFTTVGEVKDINGPTFKVDMTDVTNQSSPDGYEEKIPSIKRSGDLTFDVHFQPADATHDSNTGLLAQLNNRTLKNWRITIPNNAKMWRLAGYVSGNGIKMPVGGVMTGSITVSVVGKPTLS